jgi:hypothetical protein
VAVRIRLGDRDAGAEWPQGALFAMISGYPTVRPEGGGECSEQEPESGFGEARLQVGAEVASGEAAHSAQ